MLYRLTKSLRNMLMVSPLWVCLLVGYCVGFILYFNSKRRMTAFKNIKSVFPNEKNLVLKRIVFTSFMNMGLSAVELMIAPRIFKYIDARGLDNLQPQGGIVVAVHEGSWELHNAFLAQKENYAILAKAQKKHGLDDALNDLRREYNIKVCFNLKDIIRHIRQQHYIGMAVDHGAEDKAVFVKFFSHYVPAPGGAVYLAKKFNIPLYPCFGRRNGGFKHIAEVMPPIVVGDKSEEEILQQLNAIYEEQLRQYPQEYMWHYKRFKKKKDLDVVILNDGKTGHLKQSLAFLSFLKQHDRYVRYKIVDVRFKHPRCRVLMDLAAMLMSCRSVGSVWGLKFFLTEPVYQELVGSYADIVISSGSYLASVNRVFGYSVGAKSVSILRPNIPLRKFDVAILPEHDRIGIDTTIKIKGALCYPVDIQEKVRLAKEFFKLSEEKKLAFFVGGVLSDKREFMDNLKEFCLKLKDYAANKGYKLLISSSRRTPDEADALIKEIFYKCDNVAAMVFPKQANYDFVFDGFVGASDISFISGESISMVSEAASLQKPCVAVSFEKHEGKHKVFLDMISNEVPLLRSPYDLSSIKPKASALLEENHKIVEEAIGRLL